jgi:predicted nucleic acid-binding protein
LTTQDRFPVVYDAGALLAAERDDRRFMAVHMRFLRAERMLVVPSPVLTQSWRGGARQASLARVLRACLIEPTSEVIARNAGVLLGRSRTSDAVDAIVVATAINHGALIVTRDPDDLNLLWESAGTATKPAVIQL